LIYFNVHGKGGVCITNGAIWFLQSDWHDGITDHPVGILLPCVHGIVRIHNVIEMRCCIDAFHSHKKVAFIHEN
jgi:hypothetical protein